MIFQEQHTPRKRSQGTNISEKARILRVVHYIHFFQGETGETVSFSGKL